MVCGNALRGCPYVFSRKVNSSVPPGRVYHIAYPKVYQPSIYSSISNFTTNAFLSTFLSYKNKSLSGKNNICGEKIYVFRKSQKSQIPKMSQRILAEQLQIRGIDVDKNAVQRIESGERFVTDIELKVLAEIFNTTCDELIK